MHESGAWLRDSVCKTSPDKCAFAGTQFREPGGLMGGRAGSPSWADGSPLTVSTLTIPAL